MGLDVERWQCDSFGGITFTFSGDANTSAHLARVRAVHLGISHAFLRQTEVEHTARLGIGHTSAGTLLELGEIRFAIRPGGYFAASSCKFVAESRAIARARTRARTRAI